MKPRFANILALAAAFLAIGSGVANAQVAFNIFINDGDIIQSDGSSGDWGTGLNGFYASVAGDTDLSFDALVGDPVFSTDIGFTSLNTGISWTALVDGNPVNASLSYVQPGAPTKEDSTPGNKIVIVFTDAASVSLAGSGSQIAVAETNPIVIGTPNLTLNSFSNTMAGISGSLQLVAVVPEPAHYAALLGVLGLAFVMWRRRR